ncbi:MAG: hypothetical protein J5858_07705, partial [Lentisphaeria bacterium]|nr:hypothetical protein [Lentisphaeria bacterium]
MPEKTFYDEMIECLRLTRRNSPTVTISNEVLQEFMTDMPRKKQMKPASVPPAAPVSAAQLRTPPVQIRQELSPAAVSSMNWDELSAAVAGCRACRLC